MPRRATNTPQVTQSDWRIARLISRNLGRKYPFVVKLWAYSDQVRGDGTWTATMSGCSPRGREPPCSGWTRRPSRGGRHPDGSPASARPAGTDGSENPRCAPCCAATARFRPRGTRPHRRPGNVAGRRPGLIRRLGRVGLCRALGAASRPAPLLVRHGYSSGSASCPGQYWSPTSRANSWNSRSSAASPARPGALRGSAPAAPAPPPPPLVLALLSLVGGNRLGGEPGVVGVLRADLNVHIADDPPIPGVDGGLRNLQVPVR